MQSSTSTTQALPLAEPALPDEASKTYRKVAWRLIPFLFLCYVVAYLDRTNIGFAQLQMKQALGFSDAVYGLGAGVFFLGYSLFEVPSNLVLARIGARATLTRILIPWGIVSIAMIYVSSAPIFYVMRFLLGAFEAGLVPGALFLLTQWFPQQRRGGVIALFMLGMPISGVVGGPLAGWAMASLQGVFGLAGWQWLFVVEGIPAIALGLACALMLTDSPAKARWLSGREREIITQGLRPERDNAAHAKSHNFLQAIRDPNLYILTAAYFTCICGVYVIGFWLPAVLSGAGIHDVFSIGLYSMIPFGISAAGMVLICRSSDRRLEGRWHLAICSCVGAAMLVLVPAVQHSLTLSLLVLSIATTAIYTTLPLFWAIASAYFAGTDAMAGSLALMNSLGLIGGFVSPIVVGWFKTTTGSLSSGLYAMAALLVLGAIVLLAGISKQKLERRAPSHSDLFPE
jgi:sugar phosphate permease